MNFVQYLGVQKDMSVSEAGSVSKGEKEPIELGPTLRAVLRSSRTELSWCPSLPPFHLMTAAGQPPERF
jgi:hypothetical protein